MQKVAGSIPAASIRLVWAAPTLAHGKPSPDREQGCGGEEIGESDVLSGAAEGGAGEGHFT